MPADHTFGWDDKSKGKKSGKETWKSTHFENAESLSQCAFFCIQSL